MKPSILLALLLSACSFTTRPPVPPPDGPETCADAKATLEKHGGCGVDLTTYEQNCRDAEAAEAELGIRHPKSCVARSADCNAAQACK